jgi:hypothetical protein
MERPIIFSPVMVKAILEGKKTQTRRVIKPQPDEDGVYGITAEGFQTALYQADEYWINTEDGDNKQVKPKYKRGDILWVREKWRNVNRQEAKPDYQYFADTLFPKCEDYAKEWKWKPSIHMKREAARIFLKVVSVNVEQIRDISEENAKAEGAGICTWFRPYKRDEGESICFNNEVPTRKAAFFNLWDSINAKRGYGWESNPWVWVYEFMRIK